MLFLLWNRLSQLAESGFCVARTS